MKLIYIGFSRPISSLKPYANTIMYLDQINYSHAFTMFKSKYIDLIYQNSGHSTNFTTDKRFLKINKIVELYEIPCTEDVYARIIQLCASREGKPYGIFQVIGKGIVKITKILFDKDIKNPFADGDATTDCIEEQAKILMDGFYITNPLNMDTASVKPYHDWIESLSVAKRIL